MPTFFGILGLVLIGGGTLLLRYAVETRHHALGMLGAWGIMVGMALFVTWIR